jgi:hypothetical protein
MAINKNKRIIWSNQEFDEWEKSMLADGEDEDTLTYERYYNDCEIDFGDERMNLDVDVEGVIVCFASLGLWNGRVNGAKVVGTNVRDILYDNNCDYLTWYCDKYNVRCDAVHHDGRNHYLYRVVKDRETADRIVDKIAYKDMSEEQFRRATRSLRPYVSKVYGFR